MNLEKDSSAKLIPQINTSSSLGEFIGQSLKLIKENISIDIFRNKLRELGIQSRVTYRQIALNKRRFSENKIDHLVQAFDLTFTEKIEAQKHLANINFPKANLTPTYILGIQSVLTCPINTIVLNLCGLPKKPTYESLQKITASICEQGKLDAALQLLLEQDLIKKEIDSTFNRINEGFQLSTLPGIKQTHAQKYIQNSLNLAEKQYDLPLDQREYAAYTARIKKEDFSKLKDMVRSFRKATYEISNADECDTVIHVNINAFMLSE